MFTTARNGIHLHDTYMIRCNVSCDHFRRHNLIADQKRFKSTHRTVYTFLDTSLPSELDAIDTLIVEVWCHSENHSPYSLLKKKRNEMLARLKLVSVLIKVRSR